MGGGWRGRRASDRLVQLYHKLDVPLARRRGQGQSEQRKGGLRVVLTLGGALGCGLG